jgi:galactose mutarotase-like enzyme
MITLDITNGHTCLWMENDNLKLAVLPYKGADIAEFIHKPSGVQFLMRTPAGLQPPGEQPPADFLDNYEGGWQELFPNVNDACEYRGRSIPTHGEVALLPWEFQILQDDTQASEIALAVRCQQTPFYLERRLRLLQGSLQLEIQEKVTNEADEPWSFVWGHHLTLGDQFIEDGCRLEVPAELMITLDQLYEPETARLAPGQSSLWPFAQGRNPGEEVDLRYIPGRQAHSHDDIFLSIPEYGVWSVTNPRLGLRFVLEWDASIFRWVTLWMPYGGADLPPLTGIYGVGIEPWISRFPLAQADAQGQALSLQPGESLSTSLIARVEKV